MSATSVLIVTVLIAHTMFISVMMKNRKINNFKINDFCRKVKKVTREVARKLGLRGCGLVMLHS